MLCVTAQKLQTNLVTIVEALVIWPENVQIRSRTLEMTASVISVAEVAIWLVTALTMMVAVVVPSVTGKAT
jgi:hypothetical protein